MADNDEIRLASDTTMNVITVRSLTIRKTSLEFE